MNQIRLIAIIVILIALSVAGSYWFVTERLSDITTTLDTEIAAQEDRLMEYAEALYRNTSLPGEEDVVSDCRLKHRNRFDSYLIRLENLPRADFPELQILFDACADYFAERKAVTLRNFEIELDKLRTLLLLRDQLSLTGGTAEKRIDAWTVLDELENKRYNILREQVSLQAEIINLLEEGASPSNEAVRQKMRRANEIKETGSVLVHEVNTARSALR